jgi:hypothetical protein
LSPAALPGGCKKGVPEVSICSTSQFHMSAEWQKETGNLLFCFAIDDLTTSNSINAKAVFMLANRRRFDIFITIRFPRASE